MSTSAAGGWVARIAIASAGPTPWVAISVWNVARSSRRGEAVQRLAVLADVVVDVEEDRRRRLELGQRPRRHDDVVADAADLEQHVAVEPALEHRAAQRADHGRPSWRRAATAATPLAHRRHRQVAQGQRGGVGGVGRPRRAGQAEAGLDHLLHLLLGRAAPAGDGVLHLVRACTGRPRSRRAAASARASPLAWPTLIAVRTLTWKKTCSTATASGRNSAISAASSPRSAARRCGSGSAAGVRMTPSGDGRGLGRAPAVDHGVAAPGQPGVDAEHPRRGPDEHRFAG